jgi:hypothetical protein
MGNVVCTGTPDARANPRDSGNKHIDDGAKHEDVNGAEALCEAPEKSRKDAVRK